MFCYKNKILKANKVLWGKIQRRNNADFWSMRQTHKHSKALNAQTVGKEPAFGGEQVKTNGQAPGEGWAPVTEPRPYKTGGFPC